MNYIKTQISAIVQSVNPESQTLFKHDALGVLCHIGIIIATGRGPGCKCEVRDALRDDETLVQACWSVYKTMKPTERWRMTQPGWLKPLIDVLDEARSDGLFPGFDKFRRRFNWTWYPEHVQGGREDEENPKDYSDDEMMVNGEDVNEDED
jgi:hypothetical protein